MSKDASMEDNESVPSEVRHPPSLSIMVAGVFVEYIYVIANPHPRLWASLTPSLLHFQVNLDA